MGKLEIKIDKLRLRNPIIAVSGIYGIEYNSLFPNLNGIGAVVTKSVTYKPRKGNDEPRIIPTPAGLLNSIGLQNPGIKRFISEEIPKLRVLEVPIIASVAGFDIAEYVECSSLLAPLDEIDAIELNVSCPNVEQGGMEFGCDPKILKILITKVRKVTNDKTLIIKLTPNVTDITQQAEAAADGGADAISLINTIRGMAIDLITFKPILGNKIGGLSGQAIHPVAVYMVYKCYLFYMKNKLPLPIIGMGGVTSGEDAIELMLAGASAVGVGTAMFRNQFESPKKKLSIYEKIEEYMDNYLDKMNLNHISRIIGEAAK